MSLTKAAEAEGHVKARVDITGAMKHWAGSISNSRGRRMDRQPVGHQSFPNTWTDTIAVFLLYSTGSVLGSRLRLPSIASKF